MRRIALAVWSLILLFACWAVAVPVYQCKLHPMARLSEDLHRGDRYADVHELFSAYMREHATDQTQFNVFETDRSLLYTETTPGSTGLALYDLAVADDLQLKARFNSEGLLVETLFICD